MTERQKTIRKQIKDDVYETRHKLAVSTSLAIDDIRRMDQQRRRWIETAMLVGEMVAGVVLIIIVFAAAWIGFAVAPN